VAPSSVIAAITTASFIFARTVTRPGAFPTPAPVVPSIEPNVSEACTHIATGVVCRRPDGTDSLPVPRSHKEDPK
jgi:hypothetical protein